MSEPRRLPDCMMPDGGTPCAAYLEAVQRADDAREGLVLACDDLRKMTKERDDLLLDQTSFKSKLAEKDPEVDQSMIGSRISELIHERSELFDKVARLEKALRVCYDYAMQGSNKISIEVSAICLKALEGAE